MEHILTTTRSLYRPITKPLLYLPVVQHAGEPAAQLPPEGRVRFPPPGLRSANPVQVRCWVRWHANLGTFTRVADIINNTPRRCLVQLHGKLPVSTTLGARRLLPAEIIGIQNLDDRLLDAADERPDRAAKRLLAGLSGKHVQLKLEDAHAG
jgi:hypothetical protein